MKTLLAFFYNYFEFLYLDRRYRIVDSASSSSGTSDAWLKLAGPVLSVSINLNRGQIGIGIAPSTLDSPKNWFRVPIVRQFLDGFEETNNVPPADTVAWFRDNVARLETMFGPDTALRSCEQIATIEKEMADKYFGPAQDPGTAEVL
ncbi:hypothetical protein TUM20983_26160 [Mycobacterium antarcticum]|uniref:hypothetical protein n=1 Tax=unclassified Mycolicibacterium TaxID=2636767 RepID=UPI0023971680|nr:MULTISPECIES: hypothetical protein [unclassified Mycolicibacterium]GLP75506.1 hypothetical protein TUM20983_26160 [Mycolicibacterium sp. TUM20983]GLP84233.1 hypothetical protein TUM20984_56530 [Mycolicibacterium sp. TUM20984]